MGDYLFNVAYSLYRSEWGMWIHNAQLAVSRWRRGDSGYRCHELRRLQTGDQEMTVYAVEVLFDNYCYFVVRDGCCVAVDACDAKAVDWFLREKAPMRLAAVLSTHSHHDHSGGNRALQKSLREDERLLKFIGTQSDKVPALNYPVQHGDCFELLEGTNVHCTVIGTECHTVGHVAYLVHIGKRLDTEQQSWLFTGDCLFSAGVGKFFEGDPQTMHNSLQRLVQATDDRPDNVFIFPGHEYTVSNLKFARSIEPDNESIKRKVEWSKQQRQEEMPTIPSTMQEELDINPFLRCGKSHIQRLVGKEGNPVGTLAKLRELKDAFR